MGPQRCEIHCGSTTNQQEKSGNARMEREPQAAECQDGAQTTGDQSEFAFSEKDEPEDNCYQKAPNPVAIIVVIKASATCHYQQGNRCAREAEKSLFGRQRRRGQEGRYFFRVH